MNALNHLKLLEKFFSNNFKIEEKEGSFQLDSEGVRYTTDMETYIISQFSDREDKIMENVSLKEIINYLLIINIQHHGLAHVVDKRIMFDELNDSKRDHLIRLSKKELKGISPENILFKLVSSQISPAELAGELGISKKLCEEIRRVNRKKIIDLLIEEIYI